MVYFLQEQLKKTLLLLLSVPSNLSIVQQPSNLTIQVQGCIFFCLTPRPRSGGGGNMAKHNFWGKYEGNEKKRGKFFFSPIS